MENISPKTVAIISYLTIVGWIVALVLNNNNPSSLGKFHIRQSLGIILISVAASLLASIPILGWIISLALSILSFVLWIIGILDAIAERDNKPVPLIGEQCQIWFQSI